MSVVQSYIRLTRLDKPVGVFLLLWPTLSALWIAAKGIPSFKLFFIFTMGTLLMRSAGCAINDFADYTFDGKVSRTKNRPLVTKEISLPQALLVFSILSFLAFLLVLMTNLLTILFAFLGAILVVVYPFMKRVTHLPQVVLSIAFAFGVPMAFAAQLNQIPWIAWILFLATAFWIIVYDTFYAMVDRVDDLKAGIKSTAILFGNQDRLICAILQITVILLLMIVAKNLNFRWFNYFGIFIALMLFIYQQVLIRNRCPKDCFKAFLNNQWVGFFIFLGFFVYFSRNIFF